MHQMPVLITIEPPTHHVSAIRRSRERTRLARSSATNDDRQDISNEAATTQGS